MGRLYCNGKKGFCERVQGTAEECEKVSCTECDYADGTGAEFIDQITNYDNIRNMPVDKMAEFLTSLLDGENNHNVGCYDCMNYGTHHSDPQNKESGLYECEGCYNEGVGLDLVKWLKKEAENVIKPQ